MCKLDGAVGQIFQPIPVDPLTTKALAAAPGPIRTIANPLGPMLKRAVGEQAGVALLSPLTKGEGSDKQAKTLLGS